MDGQDDDLGGKGLEEWRRELGLSKACFYGPSGPARAVKTIQVSPKRKIVPKAERQRFYEERTRPPREAA